MALIGDSQTSRFFISMAEVRIGPLEKAMVLKPEHSIGLLNSATVSFAAESVDLEAGLPRKIYDTQVVSQLGTVAMEMREYSKRNMEFLLGYAPQDYTTKVQQTIQAGVTLNGTTVEVEDGTKFTADSAVDVPDGDIILLHPADPVNQGNVTYARVTGIASNVLTFETTLSAGSEGAPFTYAIGDNVSTAEPIAIGANSTTQYFTAQVLGNDRQGVPVGFTFWKCALSSGLEVGFNADDFNTNSGELKILTPSAADIAVGGSLNGVANMVAKYPQGMATFGGDVG